MEKLCEICWKPVTSDLEGSWGFDEGGRPWYFHMNCLKKKKSEHEVEVLETHSEIYPFEKARKVPYRP